jgi:hypothetical protein
MPESTPLEIFGFFFGVLLILDGAFGWGLVRVIPGAPGSSSRAYVRASEIIVGAIFVVIAVIGLTSGTERLL